MVRNINNTMNMLNVQKDTCIKVLKEKIKEDLMEECVKFIKERRETRHLKTLVRQKMKLEALCHRCVNRGGCSYNILSSTQNSDITNSRSSTPTNNTHNTQSTVRKK